MISRKRAMKALDVLVDKGLLTPQKSKSFVGMIEEGISYKTLMISELGKVMGELYVREEEFQHKILHQLIIPLDKLSVPEVLLLEDQIGVEPWHNERYSEQSTKGKFEQEAGEPWHISLVERFRPDPVVRAYFRDHPEISQFAPSILKSAYRV
jgi:hypothetical protein